MNEKKICNYTKRSQRKTETNSKRRKNKWKRKICNKQTECRNKKELNINKQPIQKKSQ